MITIPGDRIRNRTRVTVASKPVDLTDASLKILMRLMVGMRNGTPVHKVDLGANADQGFKGISNLRNELRPILDSVDIIKNDYHGNYSLTDNVKLGDCAAPNLAKIGDRAISDLAEQLRQEVPNRPRKSEGNFKKFPTHRRRRKD